MSDAVERRKHQRVAVRTIVRMRFQSIGDFLQSYAKDISGGGMQLAVAQELAAGDVVGLEFKLKSNYPLIEGTAEVKWCRPHGEHFMVGVAFLDLDERSRKVIEEAVQIKVREQRGIDLDSEIGSDEDVVDISDTDVLAPPAEDDADFSAVFALDETSAVGRDADAGIAPPLEAEVEPEIEELEFDVGPDVPAGVEDAPLEAVDVDDVATDAGAAMAGPEGFGASIEELEQEVEAMAAVETDAALFEDTELAGGQAEFAFDAESVDLDVEPTDAAAAPVQHHIEAVPRGGGKKRLALMALVVLVLGAAAAWWLLGSGGAPVAQAPQAAVSQEPAAAQQAAPVAVEPGGAALEPTLAAAGAPGPLPDSAATPPAEAVQAPSAAAPEPRPAPAAPAAVKPEPRPLPAAEPAARGRLTRLTGFDPGGGDVMLELVGDGEFAGRYKYFALSSPPRAVIDVLDVELAAGARGMRSQHPRVTKVRVGQHADKVRIVLDLAADRGFAVRAAGSRLVITAE